MSIEKKLSILKAEINELLIKEGRLKDSVEILAVSKTKPIEMLQEAYRSGQRLFGENRVNEAELKAPQMPEDTIFHMVGHLQSNKVKKACSYFSCIESVDSLKIAKKINTCCIELNKVMDVYIDINIVNDQNKSGFLVTEQFYSDFEEMLKLTNINILGLMCIGAYVTDKDIIRNSFEDLKKLLKYLKGKYPTFNGDKLSMGMSGDYDIAISVGTTHVRIGSTIFGKR